LRHPCWVLSAFVAFTLLVPAHLARAASPTEELQGHVAQVLELLRDPDLGKREAVAARRFAVRQIVDDVLDFRTMAERALGRHWTARTSAERAEFVRVFSDFLEATYVAEIERHGHHSITYLKESLAGDEATVETKVGGKAESRVDYRMHRRDGRWLVHDVLIGGLSLVENLRSQFNRVLRESSYADVVEKLRESGAGQATPRLAPK
jgi:phospholipid transport system substrate-binding protein